MNAAPPTGTDAFVKHRNLLFTVAYEMLGSAADAEDVLQETWLRWAGVDHDEVRDDRAYLVRITTRLALNRLRTLARQRETYVGPWLPEPLLTSPDAAQEVEQADAVSLAMLVVLETLSPAERTVFVLREVFAMSYGEVAGALGRSVESVRQMAHRARSHVQARQPRFDADPAAQRAATERFLAACGTGDLAGLLQLLAPDVELVADGGGKVRSALRPIRGADKVARFLIAIMRNAEGWGIEFPHVNGAPGLLASQDGQPKAVSKIELMEGTISRIYFVTNPEKLPQPG
jgi:RNA polymerase sigma-70 factor (TIGR02957 family)